MKIESKLVEYLTAKLNCKVCVEVPKNRPEKLVTLERTGGGVESVVIDKPTVAIQCWAATRVDALNLSVEVERVMQGVIDFNWCYNAHLNNSYFFAGEGGEPRYQLVYDFACDARE